MFETLVAVDGTIARHRDGPLFDERLRYLLHCASVGATLHTHRNRARALLWIADDLAGRGRVDAARLRELIAKRRPQVASRTASNLFNIARPWLNFLGWWDEPVQPVAFPEVLDQFVDARTFVLPGAYRKIDR